MPELPEVETVRRMLQESVRGLAVEGVRLSGASLRAPVDRTLARRVRGRTILAIGRHGKYLIIELSGGLTLLSHLGMSGRWIYFPRRPRTPMPHVHARFDLEGGGALWFQDPRRFGLLRLVATERRFDDRSLAILGPDPIASPPSGEALKARARACRGSIKSFLMDQRRLAGIGNIYCSEILHRAGVDPRRRVGRLTRGDWKAVAREIPAVLNEAIERMGTTFSAYRTLWNEPGQYGERLLVYDRADEPCRRCGTPIRRIVQAQRSTFFCPRCQPARSSGS